MSYNVVSLFTGAGGLDLGLESAGFQTAVCVESNPEACQTLKANRSWPVYSGTIQSISTRKILNLGNLKKGKISLLVGGPPCQPFSKSGYWRTGDTLRMNDPRASTVREYARVLEEALPEVFILENVPGFAYENKSEGLECFLKELKRINKNKKVNYSVSWKILNAVDFGVPQRRERLFLVGCIDGSIFKFPEATHSDVKNELLPYTTAWDSIGDLENQFDDSVLSIKGKWARLLPSIPEGHNYLWHTDRGGGSPIFEWRSRYWNFLLKLAKSKPSWTIQAQPGPATGPFHWNNRRLSAIELSRLQTFPSSYQVLGSLHQVQRQVGNAVPSALAEILGLQIRRQFFGDTVRKNSVLIPKSRNTTQRATHRRSVPKDFINLIKL